MWANKVVNKMTTALSYDDVMLVPTLSTIRSRKDPQTNTVIGNVELDIPIISSPMDTITEVSMSKKIIELGGMAMLHRFMPPEKQTSQALEIVKDLDRSSIGRLAVAVGIGDAEFERVKMLKSAFPIRSVVIDVANGHTEYVAEMIKKIRNLCGGKDEFNIIAGNVATGYGYKFLMDLGANAVRVGIGGGCFVPGSKVRMSDNSLKNIEDVTIGEKVITHTGTAKTVTNTMTFERDEEIVVINGIESTKNHEYYVVMKSDEDNITEENLHNYAFWIEADHLDADKHLLIFISESRLFSFVCIDKKEYKNYTGVVHDLTVEDDHSYNIEGTIVHNSICKTRIQTGCGVPTLTSLLDCEMYASEYGLGTIIADGGIKYPGCMVKAIAAGSSGVILGRALAATKETPGELLNIEGELWKVYRGMASEEIQIEKRGGLSKGTCAEGVSTRLRYAGDVEAVVDEYMGGLRSAMTYMNAKTIPDLMDSGNFVRITSSGLDESHAFGTRR
jgi:IMP dehydrogenase/GMP reductase